MGEENKEGSEASAHEPGCIWEQIPPERTFCEMKLYLDAEDRPTGAVEFYGDRLKALNADRLLAMECQMIYEMAQRAAQRAIFRAGMVAQVGASLAELSGELGFEEESEHDGSEGEGSGEGSGGGAGVPDGPTGSVSGNS